MNTRQIVAAQFGLDYNETMQDWELEVAEPDRIEDFLDGFTYIPSEARCTLAELLMASFDDALNSEKFSETAWRKYCEILLKDLERYREILEYWARPGIDDEDHFAVKSLVDQDLLQ